MDTTAAVSPVWRGTAGFLASALSLHQEIRTTCTSPPNQTLHATCFVRVRKRPGARQPAAATDALPICQAVPDASNASDALRSEASSTSGLVGLAMAWGPCRRAGTLRGGAATTKDRQKCTRHLPLGRLMVRNRLRGRSSPGTTGRGSGGNGNSSWAGVVYWITSPLVPPTPAPYPATRMLSMVRVGVISQGPCFPNTGSPTRALQLGRSVAAETTSGGRPAGVTYPYLPAHPLCFSTCTPRFRLLSLHPLPFSQSSSPTSDAHSSELLLPSNPRKPSIPPPMPHLLTPTPPSPTPAPRSPPPTQPSPDAAPVDRSQRRRTSHTPTRVTASSSTPPAIAAATTHPTASGAAARPPSARLSRATTAFHTGDRGEGGDEKADPGVKGKEKGGGDTAAAAAVPVTAAAGTVETGCGSRDVAARVGRRATTTAAVTAAKNVTVVVAASVAFARRSNRCGRDPWLTGWVLPKPRPPTPLSPRPHLPPRDTPSRARRRCVFGCAGVDGGGAVDRCIGVPTDMVPMGCRGEERHMSRERQGGRGGGGEGGMRGKKGGKGSGIDGKGCSGDWGNNGVGVGRGEGRYSAAAVRAEGDGTYYRSIRGVAPSRSSVAVRPTVTPPTRPRHCRRRRGRGSPSGMHAGPKCLATSIAGKGDPSLPIHILPRRGEERGPGRAGRGTLR